MSAHAIAEFVKRVRAERVAGGQPEHITDPAVYPILDGLLARGTVPTEAGTAQALARSSTTAPTAGGRDE